MTLFDVRTNKKSRAKYTKVFYDCVIEEMNKSCKGSLEFRMNKLLVFDDDAYKACQNLFLNFSFNVLYDRTFYREFVADVLNYEIKFPDVRLWQMKCMSTLNKEKEILNTLYAHLDDLITSGSTTVVDTSRGTTQAKAENTQANTTNDNRKATQELPQTQVNIDLNDDTFVYATTNDIEKDKTNAVTDVNAHENEQMNEVQTTRVDNYDIENLEKVRQELLLVFKSLRTDLFLNFY